MLVRIQTSYNWKHVCEETPMTEKLEVNGSQTVHQLKVGEAHLFFCAELCEERTCRMCSELAPAALILRAGFAVAIGFPGLQLSLLGGHQSRFRSAYHCLSLCTDMHRFAHGPAQVSPHAASGIHGPSAVLSMGESELPLLFRLLGMLKLLKVRFPIPSRHLVSVKPEALGKDRNQANSRARVGNLFSGFCCGTHSSEP